MVCRGTPYGVAFAPKLAAGRAWGRVTGRMARRSPKFIVVLAALLAGGCAASQDRPADDAPRPSRFVDADLPGGAVGYYVEGTLARAAGDDEAALELLGEAVRRDDRLILANQALGEIYRERGDLSNSETYFRRLIDRDPDTARGHFLLAEVLEVGRRLAEALDSYIRGLEIDPSAFAGNLGAGRTLLAMDRGDEAVPYLERAAEIDLRSGEAQFALARALDAAGRPGDADAAYDRAQELLPRETPEDEDQYTDFLVARGLNLIRQGRGGEAAGALSQAVERRPDAGTFKLLGDAHAAAAQARRSLGERAAAESALGDAVRAYDDALRLSPEYVAALNARGSALIRLWQVGGQIETPLRERGLDSWRESLAAEPEQPAVENALARFGGAGVLD